MLAKYLMAYVTYLAYNIWKFVKQRNIVRVCTAYLVVKIKIRYPVPHFYGPTLRKVKKT